MASFMQDLVVDAPPSLALRMAFRTNLLESASSQATNEASGLGYRRRHRPVRHGEHGSADDQGQLGGGEPLVEEVVGHGEFGDRKSVV